MTPTTESELEKILLSTIFPIFHDATHIPEMRKAIAKILALIEKEKLQAQVKELGAVLSILDMPHFSDSVIAFREARERLAKLKDQLEESK